MIKIKQYSPALKGEWDFFVKYAKNKHFFFFRDYMEYHSDRFEDMSLMFYNKNNKLISVLPVNINNNTLYSHEGLTFGGFIVGDDMKSEIMLNVFDELLKFLKEKGIEKLIYKCLPHIYYLKPAEEDLYALFRNNARLIRRDITSTINLKNKIKYQNQRKRAVKKANKNKLVFEKSTDIQSFWNILYIVLKNKHKSKPVHSVEEIEKLCKLFPDNIKLFVAKKEGVILGGTLIYENDEIAHCQYLANSTEGMKMGALDFVIDRLINEVYIEKKYFDFGISNENSGMKLNTGLIAQKEGFGARAIAHDMYEIQIL